MQQLQDHDLSSTIDEQLAQIERLAEAMRALPEYKTFRTATDALYSDPGANCRHDELPMRLYEARKYHRPLTDNFCSRDSVQAYIHAEARLSGILSTVERILSHATGSAFCKEIDLENGRETEEIPPVLRHEAEELGRVLAMHPVILANRKAVTELADDRHASDLDLRFETIRMRLKARQRAMKDQRPAEVMAFHELREEVLANALIEERDHAREEARHYLDQVAASLSHKLGLDFVAMAYR